MYIKLVSVEIIKNTFIRYVTILHFYLIFVLCYKIEIPKILLVNRI